MSAAGLAAASLMLVFAAGCGSGSSSAAGSSGSASASSSHSDVLVGVVFDSGGIGDKSFNDSANAGLQKAVKDLGIKEKHVVSASEKDYQANITAMADAGCNLIFAVGLNEEDALATVAPKYPKIDFAIIDGKVDAPNVRSLNFDEEQGSFLAGYLAAKVTKTKKLGFVGGQEIPLIKKFLAGYEAGAWYADPTVQVLPAKYTGDWDNVDIAHAMALQLFGSGADIVYQAAGRAGQGVISAAKEQNKYAIGVDSDQDYLAPGNVLTSMVKHVDVSVYQTISDFINKKFTPGTKIYDLATDGVGLTDMKYTKDKVPAGVLTALDQVKKDIISGKIKVPSTLDDVKTFEASVKPQS